MLLSGSIDHLCIVQQFPDKMLTITAAVPHIFPVKRAVAAETDCAAVSTVKQKSVLLMFCGWQPAKIKCLIWEEYGFLQLYKRFLNG